MRLFLYLPQQQAKKAPAGAKYLQWLDSTAFLMKETNKYGRIFASAGSVATIFPYPPGIMLLP
jgi:hypothetical protein